MKQVVLDPFAGDKFAEYFFDAMDEDWTVVMSMRCVVVLKKQRCHRISA